MVGSKNDDDHSLVLAYVSLEFGALTSAPGEGSNAASKENYNFLSLCCVKARETSAERARTGN